MKRKRLPDTRYSITHKLKLNEVNIYFTIGLYEDYTPGEVWIDVDQDSSGLGCAYDCFAVSVSLLLQNGIELKDLIKKFSFVRGEPNGFTGNDAIPNANSIADYLFRWLDSNDYKDAVKRYEKQNNNS